MRWIYISVTMLLCMAGLSQPAFAVPACIPRVEVAHARLLCMAGLSQPAFAVPPCIPRVEVAHAKVARVEKTGVVVLADGHAVRLEGIILPAGAGDRSPTYMAQQTISVLAGLMANRSIDLATAPPKEDRYGRVRAQVTVHTRGGAIWLQRELLRKGLARVAVAPDRGECAEELYAAEAEARHNKSGLWSSPAYAIRTPSEVDDDVGTFQIVEGKVNSVSRSGGRLFLDFASDEGTVFAATISADDLKRFREIGVDPYAYAHAKMRVRGWIERVRHRPEIALASPVQVEIVQ